MSIVLEAVAAEIIEMAKPKPKEVIGEEAKADVGEGGGEAVEAAEDPEKEPEETTENPEEEPQEDPADEEPAEEEPIELPESLRAYKEAVALLKVWTSAFAEGPLKSALLHLQGYLLPGSANMKGILLLVARMCGLDESLANDVFGEKAWESIRLVNFSIIR